MNGVEKNRRTQASNTSVAIKRHAAELGFSATGIARLDRNAHAAELDRWLAAGHAGTMTYLNRQAEKRKNPRRIMPGATSAPSPCPSASSRRSPGSAGSART